MQVNAALQHLQDSLPDDDAELSEEQEACLVGGGDMQSVSHSLVPKCEIIVVVCSCT